MHRRLGTEGVTGALRPKAGLWQGKLRSA